MMKINEKIRERRLELKMSLEDVAKIVGVNKSTILKYETGQTEKMPTNKKPSKTAFFQLPDKDNR